MTGSFKAVACGLAAGLVLLVTACSGSETTADSPTDQIVLYDQVEIVDALVEASGGDGVTAAMGVLQALDRGYSIRTVVAAIAGRRFEPLTGIVRSGNGNPLQPEGTDAGAIAGKPPLASLQRPDTVVESAGQQFAGVLAELAFGAPAHAATAPLPGKPSTPGEGELLMQALGQSVLFTDLGEGPGVIPPPARRPRGWENLDESEMRARMLVTFIIGLASEGYSAEQIVSAVILRTSAECTQRNTGIEEHFMADPVECTLDGEPPALSRSSLFRRSGNDTVEQAGTPPPAQPQPAGPDRYSGEISVANLLPGRDTVLRNAVHLTAGDTLSGTVEILVQAQGSGEGETGCAYNWIELSGVPATSADGNSYAGTVPVVGAWVDGLCPGGGPPPATLTSQTAFSARIENGVMQGQFGNFTFTARPE